MTANRWLWAAGFLLLFPLGMGMCMAGFMSVESFGLGSSGMNTRNRFNIESPAWFAGGIIVLACALLSLRGYIVRLKSDLRVNRERKAEPQ